VNLEFGSSDVSHHDLTRKRLCVPKPLLFIPHHIVTESEDARASISPTGNKLDHCPLVSQTSARFVKWYGRGIATCSERSTQSETVFVSSSVITVRREPDMDVERERERDFGLLLSLFMS
jgi:hypothetical protein